MRVPYAHLLPKVPLKAAIVAAGLGAAAAGGFAVFAWTANASRPIASAAPLVRPAKVMEIAYQRRSQSLVLAGTVVPRIESNLGFRVAGKIVARSVDVGTTVKPGDLIAQLDPSDYRLAVDNARAALASAEADHVRAKADYERYQNLRGSGAFTTQTLEQRQSLAATGQARVEQARSQLSSAENNLAYTEVGQVMAQGQGVVRVARTDELEVVVGVPEHRLKAVREARSASFDLWSDPGHRYAAKLRELSPSADPTTRTYPARFSIVDPPSFIGLGMTATLSFERPDAQPVAEVPLAAIFQRGTQPAVWVVDRNTNTVSLRPVTVARWRDDTAAISGGVHDGEIIAIAGVHKLEAGQKVRPMGMVQQAAR